MTTPLFNNRREFIIRAASVSAALSAGSVLSACGGGDTMVQFNYGVASGDPLADRVMLWTHAKYEGLVENVHLLYQVASDAAFTNIVSFGSVVASEATGYTAKADALGLAPGLEYYFRFSCGRWVSAVGRTRTLPASNPSTIHSREKIP